MSKEKLLKYVEDFILRIKQLSVSIYRDFYPYVLSLFKKLSKKDNKEFIIKAFFPLFLIGIGFYACNSSHNLIKKNIANIFEISDEIRANYSNKPDYWGLSTQALIKEGYISSKFIKNDKIILNSGDEIFIGSGIDASPVMPMQTTFDIVLPKLNKAQCIAYVEAPLTEDKQVKLLSISIFNKKGAYTFEWGNSLYSLPVKKYASKDICDNSDNTIIWSIN